MMLKPHYDANAMSIGEYGKEDQIISDGKILSINFLWPMTKLNKNGLIVQIMSHPKGQWLMVNLPDDPDGSSEWTCSV